MTKKLDFTCFVRDIADFPTPGIIFKDVTPLLGNARALQEAIEAMTRPFVGEKIDYVAAVEARGFIFGALIAEKLGTGFVPIRKKGKLPWKTQAVTYDLEYGTDTVEAHCDAVEPGRTVLMVDDLLATGGTMAAACELVEKMQGKIVGVTALIELEFLHGREKLAKYEVHTVMKVK